MSADTVGDPIDFHIVGDGETQEQAAVQFMDNLMEKFPSAGVYQLFLRRAVSYAKIAEYTTGKEKHAYYMRGTLIIQGKQREPDIFIGLPKGDKVDQ